jgi:GNAT superfamily N-acetyltransferase
VGDGPAVRRAGLDDVTELVRLRAVMMAELGEPSAGDWMEACAAYLRATLADGSTAAVVAACGVGVTLRRLPGPNTGDGRIGHVASMVTEPAWRGRGLATAIVRGLLDWYAAEGVRRVYLHASPDGEGIYRGQGFAEGAHPELVWDA